ncbi:lactococcin 972 family bacteriocin [Actinomyces respiraculi]|uniref:Lactococcin 972 family bacteriocin n=1 Tax=Actinomyces respiraculi TaxID=2744574 RepID=A0A7T0PW97_9ACTO|nr:lactococcin 972 family bacteriocin [Actinomyces respiraculi]
MRIPHFSSLLAIPLLALALAVTPTASAAESPVPDDAAGSGSVVIEDQATTWSSGARPYGIVGSHTVSVAGGQWSYGTNATTVWSRFYHPTRYHGSTVSKYDGGVFLRSPVTAPGAWSHAQMTRSADSNEAYYWFK